MCERTIVELMKYYEISKKKTTYCKLYEPIYKVIKHDRDHTSSVDNNSTNNTRSHSKRAKKDRENNTKRTRKNNRKNYKLKINDLYIIKFFLFQFPCSN
jgi:hypothetical protein